MSPFPARFAASQRLLHWLMAGCILAMLFIGVGMVSTVTPRYLTLMHIHKPLGLAILLLALIRVGVRLRLEAPALPIGFPFALKLGAYLSHIALYGLMIALPLIGWAMLSAADYPGMVLGMRLPAIAPPSAHLHTLFRELHVFLAFALFALILLHVAAALFHKLIRRDGVFETMGPRIGGSVQADTHATDHRTKQG